MDLSEQILGGGREIRTPDTIAGMPVFKTGAFNHSATPPGVSQGLDSKGFLVAAP